MYDRPCYEVEFSDGTVIVADAEHQWQTTTRAGRTQRTHRWRDGSYWSADDVKRVATHADKVLAEVDPPVSTDEIIADVGQQFRNVLYRVVRGLPKEAESALTSYLRGGREVTRRVPTYSRHRVYQALHEIVADPGRSGRRRSFDDRPVTTAEIAASLRVAGRSESWANHAVAVCGGALDYPEQDLPIAPYTLGCWLGDGTTGSAGFTCDEEELLDNIRLDGYVVTKHASSRMQYTISNRPERERRVAEAVELATGGVSLARAARQFGVGLSAVCLAARGRTRLRRPSRSEPDTPPRDRYRTLRQLFREIGTKHIPASYLRSSEQQRRALLAGLLERRNGFQARRRRTCAHERASGPGCSGVDHWARLSGDTDDEAGEGPERVDLHLLPDPLHPGRQGLSADAQSEPSSGSYAANDLAALHRGRPADRLGTCPMHRGRQPESPVPCQSRVHPHAQVQLPEHTAGVGPDPSHAGPGAAAADRPEAGRDDRVRGHPAPGHADRDQPEEGGRLAGLGRPRDGHALRRPGRRRGPAHRRLQPQGARRQDQGRRRGANGRSGRTRTCWSSSTSWPT